MSWRFFVWLELEEDLEPDVLLILLLC
jgi:hypothetical protein